MGKLIYIGLIGLLTVVGMYLWSTDIPAVPTASDRSSANPHARTFYFEPLDTEEKAVD